MEHTNDEFYNLSKFKQLSGGDNKFFQTLLEKFILNTSDALKEIIESQRDQDLTKLKAMVHKIKPSVEMLCVSKMPELIRSIQEEKSNPEAAFKFSEELIVIGNKLLKELENPITI